MVCSVFVYSLEGAVQLGMTPNFYTRDYGGLHERLSLGLPDQGIDS